MRSNLHTHANKSCHLFRIVDLVEGGLLIYSYKASMDRHKKRISMPHAIMIGIIEMEICIWYTFLFTIGFLLLLTTDVFIPRQ